MISFLFSELDQETPKRALLLTMFRQQKELGQLNEFGFEYELKGAEAVTVNDCTLLGEGEVHFEQRGDKLFLVFPCDCKEDFNFEEAAILVSEPRETGLKVEIHKDNGYIFITNTNGDKYWFWF